MKTLATMSCAVLLVCMLTRSLARQLYTSQCEAECLLFGESQVCRCPDFVAAPEPAFLDGLDKRSGVHMPFRFGKRGMMAKRQRLPFRYGKRAALSGSEDAPRGYPSSLLPSAYDFLGEDM